MSQEIDKALNFLASPEWQTLASQEIDKALNLLTSPKASAKALRGIWSTLYEVFPAGWQWEELGNYKLNQLIERVGWYLNENRKTKLNEAYQKGDYWKAAEILRDVYRHCKAQLNPQMQERKTNMDTVINANAVASGDVPWIFILALLALAIVALTFAYFKKLDKGAAPNMKIKEIMGRNPQDETYVVATEKEKDFLELIRLLATASHKTDEYLKS